MAGAAHTYPNAVLNIGSKLEKWASGSGQDSLWVALMVPPGNTYTWNGTSQGHLTMTNFLAGSGGGAITEVTGPVGTTGYQRNQLTSVTFTTSGLVNTLNCSTISWTAVTNWSAAYAVFYDGVQSSGSDSTNELIEYWDFGGTVSVVAGGNFTLTINASGLLTFTSS